MTETLLVATLTIIAGIVGAIILILWDEFKGFRKSLKKFTKEFIRIIDAHNMYPYIKFNNNRMGQKRGEMIRDFYDTLPDNFILDYVLSDLVDEWKCNQEIYKIGEGAKKITQELLRKRYCWIISRSHRKQLQEYLDYLESLGREEQEQKWRRLKYENDLENQKDMIKLI
jgi:hypothetical protein